jgi:site-specific DNA-methyltransferase (adenine-specific)
MSEKNENTLRISLDTGPCEEVLKRYPDSHFDVLITDPPYGLGDNPPDIDELLRAWASGQGYDMGKGFMNQNWDQIPGPKVFHEILRVLKPGAKGAVFTGTRTIDLMMVTLKLAGFEVEDCWRWTYGSGFPKSFNVRKHILKGIEKRYGDKDVRCECEGGAEWNPDGEPDQDRDQPREIIPDDYEDNSLTVRVCSWCLKPDDRFLDALSGKGTALKPSYEPILIIRKPEEPRDDQKKLLESYGLEIDHDRE